MNLLATHNSSLARWWRRRHSRHVSTQSPIILAGCQRSGTTLLRVILDSHPHIACGPETSLLTGGYVPHKLATRFELPEEEIWRWHDQATDHAHFVELFFSQYAKSRGKIRWAEKTPQNIRHLDYITRHFPAAKIIHVLRDGRDVVCSIRTHPKYRVVNGQQIDTGIRRPLEPCIRCWLDDTAAGMKWRGDTRYCEVRYEDLIADPEPVLRRLCDFIKEPWDVALLEHHRQKGVSRDPTHFITNVAATEPLSDQAVGRWRKDLSADELRLFYKQASQRLTELGYETPAGAPTTVKTS